MMRWFALSVIALSAAAAARTDSGTLGVIRTPNNGQPAIALRGEPIRIRAQGMADIFIDESGRLYDVAENWRPIKGGLFETFVRVPEEFSPGLYNIVGILDNVEDVQERALLVLDDAPKQYYIAHIAHPAMTAGLEATLDGAFPNPDVKFVVISGGLTAHGEPDEFRTLLDWMNTSRLATIVAPGPRDTAEGRYAEYFDPTPYLAPYGNDVVLAIGDTIPGMGEDLIGDAGRYQSLRPLLKPARWMIGLTGYAYESLSPRMQIVLFVDTPLHVLVTGHPVPTGTEDHPPTVAWDSFQGATRLIGPASEKRSGIQWIHVTPLGVELSRPPENGS